MTAQVKERPRIKIGSMPSVSPRLRLSKIELIALTLAVAAVGLTVGYYFTSLAPVQARLATVEREMEVQKHGLTVGPNDKPSEKQMLKMAKESLAAFESQWLKPYDQGRIEAINELNALVKADDVHLTSGISFHSVANKAVDEGKSSAKKKKDNEFLLDVYPRVQMGFAVFGKYPALRKFVKDLQSSKQFLVIESISIAPLEQKQGRGGRVQIAGPVSGLTLTVTLNAFFHPQSQQVLSTPN